jgi:prepilin-type N-terminal cleavage/methylation domain-containing protein
MNRCVRRERGFTLIELAVVIVVVALLLGSLLVPLNSQVQQRNVTETQRRLEEAREALIGYAMVNGRLPRPAVSNTDGAERTTACATNADCTGFLPWVALGVGRTDAFGKLIRYSVTPAMANAGVTMSSAGNKTVKTYQGSTAVILANDAAAVLISHGVNNYGTTETGVLVPDNSSTNLNEDDNATNDGTTGPFWARTVTDNPAAPGGEFDDQVVILPTPLLISRLIAAGKLP